MRALCFVLGLIALMGCTSEETTRPTTSGTNPSSSATIAGVEESSAMPVEFSRTATIGPYAHVPPPATDAVIENDEFPKTVFAVRFLPGPKWVVGKSPMEQPGIQEHGANMDALHERHVLWCGGPFLDGTGGLAILRVESIEEAKRIASEDPGVKSGLLLCEVHPWLLLEPADK
jgi:uncharacterized protein